MEKEEFGEMIHMVDQLCSMTREQLRLECLTLALKTTGEGTIPSQVTEIADKYFNYIKEGERIDVQPDRSTYAARTNPGEK